MLYIAILAAITLIVGILSAKSSMLRNEIFSNDNFCAIAAAEGIKKPRPAFSLGRLQLAFWTVIVTSSFLFILIATSTSKAIAQIEVPVVNLTLLGIAAGTTVMAKVIDNSQKDNQSDSISQQDYPSKGFLMDIVSDEKGVSIHRLQNVLWMFIVGGLYIAHVAASSKLPDEHVITNELLGLLGISAGAYLGLKTTENKAAPISPATTNVNLINNNDLTNANTVAQDPQSIVIVKTP